MIMTVKHFNLGVEKVTGQFAMGETRHGESTKITWFFPHPLHLFVANKIMTILRIIHSSDIDLLFTSPYPIRLF